jgi:hypothetical protein
MEKKRHVGRPKKSQTEKLENPVPVKFSAFDKNQINERAKKERMQPSPWIRKVVLDKLNGIAK